MRHRPTSAWVCTIAIAVLALHTGTAGAATPEQACQKARYAAAAKYAACEQKTTGGHFGGVDFPAYPTKLSKCRVRYVQTWAKLQAKAIGTGSSCDQPRFSTSMGVVTDNLTGLQWEQMTDDASIHDKDNTYTWSAGAPFVVADGTAYSGHLATLNGGVCFAAQCDWRLPSRAELQTILLPEAYPCTTNPCIDTTVFGPIGPLALGAWTSTTYVTLPDVAFGVDAASGGVFTNAKFSAYPVRAVRGGL